MAHMPVPHNLRRSGVAPLITRAEMSTDITSAANRVKARSLAILPEEAPLRRSGPFVEEMRWEARKENIEAPRALRSLGAIVDGGLCHRCGSCVGICPTGVLGMDDDEYPRIQHLSACTDCDLCVKVCPGDEFDYQSFYQQVHGRAGNLTDTHGHFQYGTLGYATDPEIRERSTSGGVVTALLLHLLDTKQIDGALVIGSSQTVLWKGRPFIARTREEVLGTMKSKYAITPTNISFAEVRESPGRYALVGLPCQIHGYLKAAMLDARLRERIVLTIGLFCHAAIEHEAFPIIWEHLGDKAKQARRFISRVGKHPGSPHVELEDGSLHPVYFGSREGYRPSSIEVINVLYRLYTPQRCTTCFDALSEFADISVGDPWMAPPEDDIDFYKGYSSCFIRTDRGRAAYEALVELGKVHSVRVTVKEALSSNETMAGEKRWRAFRVIETHRRQGKAIPEYGSHHFHFPQHQGLQFLKTELHMLSHTLCFLPSLRAWVLRFLLGSGGYYLFWLNHQRRVFKFWLRDSFAALRRRVFGRR